MERPDIPMPVVDIKWKRHPLLESRISQRITQEAKLLLIELKRLSKEPTTPNDAFLNDWTERFKKTHLHNPNFWKEGPNYKKGWGESLRDIWEIVHDSIEISIDTLSVIIEYKEHTGAGNPKEDIDAIVTITVTFSASKGDPVLEGTLRHSRVCDIDP
jgi:hypothetical protein